MTKQLQQILFGILLVVIAYFGAVGMKETYTRMTTEPVSVVETTKDTGWQLKEPAQSAEFIAGPLAANVGELCVFRLNDSATKADWIIVRQSAFGPQATCYIDSSGSSLAFASNVSATYTIIAAIIEDGVPKILTHICEYGISPEPSPSPIPNPTPEPTNLTDWVSKNIPEGGRSQCTALASCYESAAEGIDKGTIKSIDAAYSAIRTATQTKIKPEIWGTFLDALSIKITERLGDSNDVKKLGTIFSEIANGLKSVSDVGEVLKLPFIPPTANCTSDVCTDPTERPRSRR